MRGCIRLCDFREEFLSALSVWTPADYERHWREAASALVANSLRGAFLTSYAAPEASYHVIWPAWREGDRVFVHNRLLFAHHVVGPVFPGNLPDLIGERLTVDEDGQRVSEWEVNIASLAAFVRHGQ
jgi:CdiI N-terminal domain